MPTEEPDFRRLINFFQEPVLIVDSQDVIAEANAAAYKLFAREALQGRSVAGLAADREGAAVTAFIRRCSGAAAPCVGALTLTTARGPARLKVKGARISGPHAPRMVALRFEPAAGQEFRILARQVRDLNRELERRRRVQAQLEEALTHNRNLLRELQHRVKNQIQMLLAMFSQARRQAKTEELTAFLDVAASRLRAIVVAQQLMYRGDDVCSVPMQTFVSELAQAIAATWPPGCRLVASADDVHASNDAVVPLGLIINELLSNALKHGLRFAPGSVELRLAEEQDDLVLSVRDTGPGVGQNAAVQPSSGLELVRGLCRQIGASLTLVAPERAHWEVRFPRG